MTTATTHDPTLIVAIRTPLTGQSAVTLAAKAIEHPNHVVAIEGPWLTLRHPIDTTQDAAS